MLVEKRKHFRWAVFDHRACPVGFFEIRSPKGHSLGLSLGYPPIRQKSNSHNPYNYQWLEFISGV